MAEPSQTLAVLLINLYIGNPQQIHSNFQCQSIAINDSQLSFSTSRTANTFLAAPNGSAGAATFRTIVSADLPTGTLSGSGTAGYIPYYSAAASLANSSIYLSSGSVGIGTTNPNRRLHVQNASGSGTGLTVANNDFAFGSVGTSLGIMTGAASGNTYTRIQSYTSGETTAGNLILQDAGGNVGIGTTSPTLNTSGKFLHINESSTGAAEIHFTNSSPLATGTDGLVVGKWDENYGDGSIIWNYEATPLVFATNSLERMRIDSTGNVGIGTTAPSSVLDVETAIDANQLGLARFFNGGAVTANRFTSIYVGKAAVAGGAGEFGYFSDTATPTNGVIILTNYLDSQYSQSLAIKRGGNVGIGTTAPACKLDVDGQVRVGSVSLGTIRFH